MSFTIQSQQELIMFVKIFDAFIDGMERQSKQLCSMMEHKFKYSNVLNDIKIILSRKKLFELRFYL